MLATEKCQHYIRPSKACLVWLECDAKLTFPSLLSLPCFLCSPSFLSLQRPRVRSMWMWRAHVPRKRHSLGFYSPELRFWIYHSLTGCSRARCFFFNLSETRFPDLWSWHFILLLEGYVENWKDGVKTCEDQRECTPSVSYLRVPLTSWLPALGFCSCSNTIRLCKVNPYSRHGSLWQGNSCYTIPSACFVPFVASVFNSNNLKIIIANIYWMRTTCQAFFYMFCVYYLI